VFVSDEDENKQPRRHWPIPEKGKPTRRRRPSTDPPTEFSNMRRTNTPTGSKFTVRGQVYVQTGAFYHEMGNGREVRVLELQSACPECGDSFPATASMRQISTRQLVRRCPACREIHSGPVVMPEAVAPKPRRRVSKAKSHRPAVSAPAAPTAPVAPQAAVLESYMERLAMLD
jgi:hypothetical protein